MKSNPSIAVRFQINPCVSISCALSYRFLVVVREVFSMYHLRFRSSLRVRACAWTGGARGVTCNLLPKWTTLTAAGCVGLDLDDMELRPYSAIREWLA